MDYVLNLFLLVFGFALLIKGADLFVDGSSSVAKLLKIPAVIIGLTIVSIGTSLPEAAVSISASIKGAYDLSIANVVGSNIFNLLSVVGVSAFICPFIVDKVIMKRDFPLSILSAVILAVMMRDRTLSVVEATILFVLFIGYILLLVRSALKNRTEGDEYKTHSPLKSIIFIIIGIVGIVAGGTLTVDAATFFARAFNMSELLIGLTIVAVGTSLPELVTSVVAAKKGESEIALGNVIGSNIFNILFILGMSGIVHPLTCDFGAVIDTILLIGMSALMFFIYKARNKVSRLVGLLGVVIYVIYVVYIILRAYEMLPF
ncbi:MAG: calcium/sodium antiporter [Clostridia bacterium]|nr:calcium/sodium antiporter [Clostridia bacterium]